MTVRGNLIRVRFRAFAATNAECGGLDYVEARSNRTADPDQAKAIAAQFPKRLGVRAHRFIGRNGASATGEVVFRSDLFPGNSKHGVNESGVKRYRSFLEHAGRLGYEVHYDSGNFRGSANVLPSEEEFERRLQSSSSARPS
jgi:hypothetical protein